MRGIAQYAEPRVARFVGAVQSRRRVAGSAAGALWTARMTGPRRRPGLLPSLLALAACLLGVTFALYLIYDRVYLAITRGSTEQRVGIISRAAEPEDFWSSVAFDGLMAVVVLALFSTFAVVAIRGCLNALAKGSS